MGKLFQDSIHGTIELSPISVKIVDTPEFQRLRNIKQLGSAYYVFGSASHNRFEHSIGVAHLARSLMFTLKMKQPELEIEDQDLINVEVAGLCHDLGHGPFSHIFDDMYFAKKLNNDHPLRHHEQRSCIILEKIVKKYGIDISEKDLDIIKRMIHPELKEDIKNFKFQIVCNQKSGVDVDKFDYISRDTYAVGVKYGFDHLRFFNYCRVVKNEICFCHKEMHNLYEMFHTRYRLHRQIYSHPIVKKIDMMIADIFNEIDKSSSNILPLKKSCENIDNFCQLTDNILSQLELIYENLNEHCDDHLKNAYKIFKRIKQRKLYTIKEEIVYSSFDELEKIKKEYNIDENSSTYCLRIIGYGSKNMNPLYHVKFYDKDKIMNRKDVNKKIGSIIPRHFEDKSLLIFDKNEF